MDVTLTVATAGGSGTFEITGADVISDNRDEDGLIKIVSRRANAIDLDIGPLDSPRILLYLDAWYPGWHAYVDKAEMPLLQADDGFKAVEIPAGTHHLLFLYRPTRAYAAISLSGTALAAAAVFFLWRKTRRTARGKYAA